ncbi:substrate-binding domain-containing protein [Protaetiibacter mangrovi]|uniref:Substrate-binding domain-containing protein n=1 Tax=Protaetiibacter mangrovi TaxID=2970926 RepID=A0ABT1ZGL7_9MICO|nr:substrate-binding domain-containing protein [Protaetiibacter mangrovi]MCS0499837.1 substrate-binding domain-containing protein [Protaetiibacter mangrovi]TPX02963.1 substrate-binding domain-containing protein [Schumannella luteola]
MRHPKRFPFVAAAAVAAFALTGCAVQGSDAGARSTRACIVLPDTTSSPRWEGSDRPALERAVKDAGFQVVSDNAEGDSSAFLRIASEMIDGGCGVMILADVGGAAAQVAIDAHARGIPVVAYDRPFTGADFLVSFDYERIGALQGQSILDGLSAAGVDPGLAVVDFVGGDDDDPTAALTRQGAVGVLAAAGVSPSADLPAAWDAAKAAETVGTSLDLLGRVDAIWAANDTNAAGAIQALDARGMRAIVTGQDATLAGLRSVLLGTQASTVLKPYSAEAKTAAQVAVTILFGETPESDGELDDGTPYVYVHASLITPERVSEAIDAGAASLADVCAGIEDACSRYHVA